MPERSRSNLVKRCARQHNLTAHRATAARSDRDWQKCQSNKMFILHGTFLPGAQKFVLWAEQDELVPRKQGRQSKSALHPFGMATRQLAEWLIAAVPNLAPTSSTQVIWLPSYDTLPQPSPELAATGAIFSPTAESLT